MFNLNELYYKIIINDSGELDVVCLQLLDEKDYDTKRWFNSINFPFLQIPLKFDTEEKAIEWIKVFKAEIESLSRNTLSQYLINNVTRLRSMD